MEILEILNNKGLKAKDKRTEIANRINNNEIMIEDIISIDGLNEKQTGIILEVIEEITRKKPQMATPACFSYVERLISSDSNTLKREASRIVGNIAHLFPENLNEAIQKLLGNSNDESTVVRWGSAYALGRIIVIPEYANSELFDQISLISENEADNGVKNQYLNHIKKAAKIRAKNQ